MVWGGSASRVDMNDEMTRTCPSNCCVVWGCPCSGQVLLIPVFGNYVEFQLCPICSHLWADLVLWGPEVKLPIAPTSGLGQDVPSDIAHSQHPTNLSMRPTQMPQVVDDRVVWECILIVTSMPLIRMGKTLRNTGPTQT